MDSLLTPRFPDAVAVGAVAAGAVVAFTALPAAASPAEPPAPESVTFDLPDPTGPYDVGTAELRLVDEDRTTPWTDDVRELAVSVWYPARHGPGDEPAPYADQRVGDLFTEYQVGQRFEGVDWESAAGSAVPGARVDRRAGRLPVLLYSPGAAVPRVFGTSMAQDLASHGYAVVAVDHTGEAPVRFPDGRFDDGDRHWADEPNLITGFTKARVPDTRFVLDSVEAATRKGWTDADGRRLPGGLAKALDPSTVGMFGMSLGGATTVHGMGADERIDAGIDMDGSVDYTSDPEFAELFPTADEGLDRPFMFMGGSRVQDGELLPNTHHTFEDWGRLWDNSTGWKRDVGFAEARHYSFTDFQVIMPQIADGLGLSEEQVQGTIGTADDPLRLEASQRAYVRAFFDHHLRGEPRPILDADSPEHPDARLVD
ncbi:hypothetical protein O4J56_02540 [Nocardiopsis sp. RSe5-2]|uniref:Lipase n=1 Tax=Nocardiopsis endophytica TaxID=3018445 RepID=A0ABT4TXT0_9ACTN|nr:hypothetical protein [Nocardiopsis endophytica]MDA2809506.1 hypothetical protein [Nocardiopsis endophytica]